MIDDENKDGATPAQYHTTLRCAAIVNKIEPREIEELAAAGYDGVESRATNVTLEEAREARRVCEANGLKIHSVMKGARFNRDECVEEDVESLRHAIQVAGAYGASSILVVPGAGIPAPALSPWEYRFQFDPETLMVSRISDGDQTPFAEFIAAQNYATTAVRKHLPKVLDVAAYEGVKIGSYFDLGNYVKITSTVECLRALGKGIIVKLHFKDFLVDHSLPNGGSFVPVGLGSNDWLAIRQTLDDIDYNGFATIEFEESESLKLSHRQQVQKFKNFFDGVDILRGV